MKFSQIMFKVSAGICFVYAVLYCLSLVFIPVGVYCFIAGKRFIFKSQHMMDMYSFSNQVLRNYVIFASIICFPFGLVSLIPYFISTSNNVKVSSVRKEEEANNIQYTDVSEEQQISQVEPHKEESDAEKIEKYNKLKKFHEKGIITDDELEMAKKQLFGDD